MENKFIENKFIRPGIINTFQNKEHVKLNKYGTGIYNVHELIYIVKHAKKTKHSIFYIYDNLWKAYSCQSNVTIDDIINELFEDKQFIHYFIKNGHYFCYRQETKQRLYNAYHNDRYILNNIRKSMHFHFQIIRHFSWSVLNWEEKKRFIMRVFAWPYNHEDWRSYIKDDKKSLELINALDQIDNLSDC